MRWQLPQPVSVPDDLRHFVGGHPLIAERLTRIGLTDPTAAQAFLDPNVYQPTSPFALPDMTAAVERLARAIRQHEAILIWGDFDVDGQTATTLLFTALRSLGANVQYHMPLRDGEGHGMHLPKLHDWLAKGVNLIITCDTGITSHEAVRVAHAAGVDVIITDHHLLGDTLPEALAVINPMRLPPEHALRELPGVAVAYQLIVALNQHRNTDELLDLVALGIVADVAEQKKDTRYLLQRGLARMRVSARLGLRALLELARINPLTLDESDIGFGLGPRLNAQGRMGNAADSVELLATDDPARAAELANQLEGMNARRKLESRLVEESARRLLERDPSLLEYAAIVLAHPDWTGGVVGIVANRLADEFHKPVVLLCEQGPSGGNIAFGSARSVPGVNITDALKACREKLLKFGGHAMAAGMTLRRDDIFEFRRLLSRAVRELATETAAEPVLPIDAMIRLSEINLPFEADVRRLGPFGNGNPPLALASTGLHLARKKKLGRQGEHMELVVADDDGTQQRVLWWNAGSKELPGGKFDLAYQLRLSRFGETPELVLEPIDLQTREGEAIEVSLADEYEVADFSQVADSHAKLAEVLADDPAALVWREADASLSGSNRLELKEAATLIVWTTPPGPEEWQAALDVVKPGRIVVFNQRPAELTMEAFLQRLGGLLKFVLNAKGGETSLRELAAAMAQRTDAVRYGLSWFQHSGQLEVEIRTKGRVSVVRNLAHDRPAGNSSEQVVFEKLLRTVLAETVAYRNAWTP